MSKITRQAKPTARISSILVAKQKKNRTNHVHKVTHVSIAQPLNDLWEKLCNRHLPIVSTDSIWRFNRPIGSSHPPQGWKLHISATLLSANDVLKRVAPYLCRSGILFKAVRSLQELAKLNSGLYYGFSQVGKAITVYPKTAEDAALIADKLHKLTYRLSAPPVPYDLPFRQDSCIYYRYGAFASLEIEQPDGKRIPAIRNPTGELEPDLREPGSAVPSWAIDPFAKSSNRRRSDPPADQRLKTILAYEALSQRGKGGVYRALDVGVLPARLCVLKEGRRHGETEWDGRDGYWRVRHEGHVLTALEQSGVNVPKVYSSFRVGTHYYLVTEFIEGNTLQAITTDKRRRVSIEDAIRHCADLAVLVSKIHSAGWIWRDCKPLNLIVTNDGLLRPVDFEGACSTTRPDRMPWGTNGYIPPEWAEGKISEANVADDLYALGATMHQVLCGRNPNQTFPLQPIGKLRRHVPKSARVVISALLDQDPQSRPRANEASQMLAMDS